MAGWLKLHRDLMDKPIWKQSTPEQKSILITLLMMADYEPNEWEWQGQTFATKPGQFVTSLEKIAQKAGRGISIQNVRTALVRFEKLEFLTNESTKTGRLISIVNWGLYQTKDDKPNKAANRRLTKTSQRPNKDLTPNKEVKKERREEDIPPVAPPKPVKVRYAEAVTLTEAEHQKLLETHGEEDTARLIEILNNYKLSSGKKYKSDYHAILTWVIKRLAEEKGKSKQRHNYPQEQGGSLYDDPELYRLPTHRATGEGLNC